MGSRTNRTEFPEGLVTVSRTNEVDDSRIVVTYELEHDVGGYAVVEIAERLLETRITNSKFHPDNEPRQYALEDDQLTFEAVVPPDETETVILGIEYEDEAAFPVGEPTVDLVTVRESREGDDSDTRSDESSGLIEREGEKGFESRARDIKGASSEDVEKAVARKLGERKDDRASSVEIETNIERSRQSLEEPETSPEDLKTVIARQWEDVEDEVPSSRGGGDGSLIMDRPESANSADEESDGGELSIDGDDSPTEPSGPVDDAGTDQFTYVGSTESDGDATSNAEHRTGSVNPDTGGESADTDTESSASSEAHTDENDADASEARTGSFDEENRFVDDPSTSGTAIDGAGSAARGSDSHVSALLDEIRDGRVDDEELVALRSELGFGRSEQLRIRRIQSRMEDFELHVAALEERIDGHGRELVDVVEDELESVHSEVDELEREIGKLTRETSKARKHARSVEESTTEEISALRRSVETDIADLRTEIEGLVALRRTLVDAVEVGDLDD